MTRFISFFNRSYRVRINIYIRFSPFCCIRDMEPLRAKCLGHIPINKNAFSILFQLNGRNRKMEPVGIAIAGIASVHPIKPYFIKRIVRIAFRLYIRQGHHRFAAQAVYIQTSINPFGFVTGAANSYMVIIHIHYNIAVPDIFRSSRQEAIIFISDSIHCNFVFTVGLEFTTRKQFHIYGSGFSWTYKAPLIIPCRGILNTPHKRAYFRIPFQCSPNLP